MNGTLKGAKITYRLSIFDRVNILLGSSGEGKTLLRSAINEVTSGDGEFIIDSIGITKVIFYDSKSNAGDISNGFKEVYNSFVVIDEGVTAVTEVLPKYTLILRNAIINNNVIIFVDRGGSDFFVSVSSILYIDGSDIEKVIRPYYNKKPMDILNSINVTSEDSGSGLELVSKLFNRVCNSSFGNGNIIKLSCIQSNMCKESDTLLYFVDGSVFGYVLTDVSIKKILVNNTRFVFIPSIEYLLLKSIDIITEVNTHLLDYNKVLSEVDEKFNHPTLGVGYNEVKTPERYYEALLKSLLKEKYNIVYNKKSIGDIYNLIDANKALEEINKWVDSYWGYTDLNEVKQIEQKETITFERFAGSF